jgi:hypothetical protein
VGEMTEQEPLTTAERLKRMGVACAYLDGYTYATDGPAAIKIHSEVEGLQPNARMAGAILDITSEMIAAMFLAPEDVADIAPDVLSEPMHEPAPGPERKEEEECEQCGGDGECECECGDIHECSACGGTGSPVPTVSQYDYRHVARLGETFDVAITRKWLAVAPTPANRCGRITTKVLDGLRPVSMLWMAGDGWELVQMPLRYQGESLELEL